MNFGLRAAENSYFSWGVEGGGITYATDAQHTPCATYVLFSLVAARFDLRGVEAGYFVHR